MTPRITGRTAHPMTGEIGRTANPCLSPSRLSPRARGHCLYSHGGWVHFHRGACSLCAPGASDACLQIFALERNAVSPERELTHIHRRLADGDTDVAPLHTSP